MILLDFKINDLSLSQFKFWKVHIRLRGNGTPPICNVLPSKINNKNYFHNYRLRHIVMKITILADPYMVIITNKLFNLIHARK